MKLKSLLYSTAILTAAIFGACDDDVSEIGGSLSEGTLVIYADSLTLEVPGRSVEANVFDGRSDTHLLGRLSSPQFGDLSCSFVAQMMAASSMNIPDSIDVDRVDSVKMIFAMPRGQFTGDSLAPQQLTVYRLQKQLPADLKSNFDPTGYFSESSILGKRTYTLSEITVDDTVSTNRSDIRIGIDMPIEFGRRVFTQYRTDPSVFAWPTTFNEYFPGIYVTRTFGSGCVANVSKVEFMLYYHYLYNSVTTVDGVSTTVQKHLRDSVALFATAPEVLSSNSVTFSPGSDLLARVNSGETILASPGGYNVEITFPAQTLIQRFTDPTHSMAVISGLNFTIPAAQISNNLGITPPPYLLMVKTSELADYFADNKKPDNVSSFYAAYDEDKGTYAFSNMREYILPILEAGNVDKADTEFTLIPAQIATQSYTSSGKTYTIVTQCTPYQARPSMVRLDMSAASIVFTYSLQQLK